MNRSMMIGMGLWLAAAGTAHAGQLLSPSDRTGFWDFTIQTRYSAATDFEGDGGSKLSLEDDLGWGFGIEYNLNEHFNIGGFFSWRTIDYTALDVDQSDPTNTTSYSGWLDTGDIALSAQFNLLRTRFTPYASGSVGWAMIDTNIPSGISTGCYWDPWWGYICDGYATSYSVDGTAYSLGLGLSLQVSDIFFIRGGYERMFLDVDNADDHGNIVRIDAGFLYR